MEYQFSNELAKVNICFSQAVKWRSGIKHHFLTAFCTNNYMQYFKNDIMWLLSSSLNIYYSFEVFSVFPNTHTHARSTCRIFYTFSYINGNIFPKISPNYISSFISTVSNAVLLVKCMCHYISVNCSKCKL